MYAPNKIGELGPKFVPMKKYDESATDILHFSKNEEQNSYNHRVVTSFSRPVSFLFIHDDRLIVDKDVYMVDLANS